MGDQPFAGAAELPRAVVAVLTFRRPEGLASVLPPLVEQVQLAPVSGHVLVVDNDPAASARETVGGWADRGVVYAHEPRPGIAAARNRALELAGEADVVVFIDDDEVPTEGWLGALVGQWQQHRVAAVAGPVLSRFDAPVDPWITAGDFFARPRRSTGTRLQGAATNNLLLDLSRLRASGIRFDDAFGLTGGSDTMLTHALVQRGEEIVWCDEAVVVEDVPSSRTTRWWVLRRSFRAGTVWSRVALALGGGRAGRLRRRADLTLRSLGGMVQGLARWVVGRASRDVAREASGARLVAGRLGSLLGAYGYIYVEYRRGGSPRARRSRRPSRPAG
jgi:succinoglycan biosynthesis protein ExoM